MAIQRILNRSTQSSAPVHDRWLDRWPLHDAAATQLVEQHYSKSLPAHTLMRRAGASVARLCMALAPHAIHVWIACGPGNNGGDGLQAAAELQRAGLRVEVTWLGDASRCSPDTLASLNTAKEAGVAFSNEAPEKFDVAIDAMLGVGSKRDRPLAGHIASWAEVMNQSGKLVLSVDLPTGLDADTGVADAHAVRAAATLTLLTLKPGLVTAQGRDHAGDIWFDPLLEDDAPHDISPVALLVSRVPHAARLHASHKGSFGDVAVVGGALGMTGAAVLAARAALHQGAGRVFVALLDDTAMALDPLQPELMFRHAAPLDIANQSVVCGCGGGEAIRSSLARFVSGSRSLVLDADALNAVSMDIQLQQLLERRGKRGAPTVLTPHPLEAARLLSTTTAQVQADRLSAAQQLADRFQCTVVLKGSGTVIASPGKLPAINSSGNAKLATAGTGDVLAGMCGALLASSAPAVDAAFEAAVTAVFLHGKLADEWRGAAPLTASALAASAAAGEWHLGGHDSVEHHVGFKRQIRHIQH